METITKERKEVLAILQSMVEGVVAILCACLLFFIPSKRGEGDERLIEWSDTTIVLRNLSLLTAFGPGLQESTAIGFVATISTQQKQVRSVGAAQCAQ